MLFMSVSSNTTDATSETGTGISSGAPEFTPSY
jgi:hypothetical protein